ncbi:helix-turn-helix domain-containing protein [Leifsonia poae]|uniref:helix-turn-helix domain-containing protein n=1 Tax=Leifsonia poae TaxID=110933 RepID=UPI001CBD1305|nr:helix-turn-helix transcriptional regulator [Leifsonia poae]
MTGGRDTSDDGELGRVLDLVAPRLRALRRHRESTLAEIAEATGISVSTLSRLESGLRRPTLELLLPLAKVYRVPLDELVGAPATGDPRIHPRPVRREGRTYVPLTRGSGSLNAFKQLMPGRKPGVKEQRRVHDGYEWVYVLSGSLLLGLGEEEHVLVAGEAAEFDTRTPHSLGSATAEPVEVISLFSRQGESVHLREL